MLVIVALVASSGLFYEPDFIFVTKLRQVWEREKQVNGISRMKIKKNTR